MRKYEVRELYKQVKRKRFQEQRKPHSLFETEKKNGGCQSCGKVTWKPY
ncbi:hypothetical protein JOD43_000770 [Pullulanibacillus pueri]|uniref:Uncharacterized protein n=1 Tax=Pullulanibacillus pueri TaxID=1437324 RepID=A0A8J2ZWX6_9BACL|nr:hypothetical protein [Pullulanibacillus pueri]MBM7680608.1 hypothetical protein [Pullulanibacillus pueri]GGH83953.1 hypothetical protein GCM10007096_25910 [Pullulanibacillus pueri]